MNPLPADIGGGPTDTETMYLELRKAVGENAPGPPDGLEDLWRQCKASALAASGVSVERAILQRNPGLATDLLPAYERQLGLAPAATDVERRAAALEAWTLALSAEVPSLQAELTRIDPALAVQVVDYDQATVVQFGKQFGPRIGGPAYGNVSSSPFPNYSTDFVLLVLYTLAPTQTTIPGPVRAAVARFLNTALSSWVDWAITTGTPFYLDGGVDGTSLLDQTGFG
jgi:hypothetical protein